MGAFHFVAKTDETYETGLRRSREYFAKAGFTARRTIENEHFIFEYYPKIGSSQPNFLLFPDGDFIFSVGTFLYRGLIGQAALERFFREGEENSAEDLHGHYIVILQRNGRTVLLQDPTASQDVFITSDNRCLSSTFLTAAAHCDTLTINPQEVYEYVFGGSTLGNGTLFSEIRRLGLFERVVFAPLPSVEERRRPISPPAATESRERLIDANFENLSEYIGTLARLFGNNINLSVSGGYDSRLLASMFRNHKVEPRHFVYGPAGDPDVEIPRAIFAAEGMAFTHIDKAKLSAITPENFAAVIEKNFYWEDGVNFNGIFHNGAELVERVRRGAGDALHVNGGGGEVFRNFFNLLERGITTRQFVWTFFSRFDPASCSEQFQQQVYDENISKKIHALLDLDQDRLSRQQVECLYPYFRCRSWFGRDNSINSKHGYSVLPFFDHAIVDRALKIPSRFKYFGNFEAALIRKADARLAAYKSIYGFSFQHGAPFKAALGMYATYLRPIWLRRRTFRLKSAVKPDRRPLHLTNAYLSKVIDQSFPYMSRFFKIDKVPSEKQFSRICTLEYLCQRLSAVR